MQLLIDAWSYGWDNQGAVGAAITTQLQLSALALAIAALICIPLGVIAGHTRWIAFISINIVATARVIPSIAILFLALPYLGLGFAPALVALTVLACPPILINTAAAFNGVDAAILEAARGMGMSALQRVWEVEVPLALPVVLAGIRTATVEVIASATLATFIGGGGLGDFISQGFATNDARLMLVGAVPVAVLALAAELLLGGLQRTLTRF